MPGLVLPSLMSPTCGPWQPLDFLTISPIRHGALLRWEVTAPHLASVEWEVTWRDLAPLARLGYVLDQPISAAAFQFELAVRSPAPKLSDGACAWLRSHDVVFAGTLPTIFQLGVALTDFLDADGPMRLREATLTTIPSYWQHQ
ncbi:unnamed protein product [Peronospora destructor]|uniref:Uncharacterized protein n=1 Tax=Peronospora destructor TaxID=86335 RepID=A0AAV0V0B8_9STRA|nr:unnamed protein product [Peronospora destructor]